MKLPILSFFIIFCIWLKVEIKKSSRNKSNTTQNFWERESLANSTRRKPTDSLNYITVSLKSLPLIEINDEIITKCNQDLLNISTKKILNLSGMSNTDIKSEYGVANLPELTEYDNNFTTLCSILNKLSVRLNELGYTKECKSVLEYAVSIGCDVINVYKMLADIYIENNDQAALEELKVKAQSLNNIVRNSVLSYITEINS